MWKFTPGGERAYTLKCKFSPISVNFQRNDQFHFLYLLCIMLNLSTYDLVWFNHSLSGHGCDHRPMALCRCKSNSDVCTPDQTPIMSFDTRLIIVMHTLLTTLLISEFYVVVMGVHALLIIL